MGWVELDLEKDSDLRWLARDPEHFLIQHPNQVLIDEAQIYPELFPALRVSIDQDRARKGRFLLTGSSSPELLSRVSETLAGRIGILELSSLKASERYSKNLPAFYGYLKGNPRPNDFLSLKAQLSYGQLESFFLEGGLPEVASITDAKHRERWFQSYVATYINRDIRRLFPRLQIETYKLFISMLAQLNGKLINMADIARSLGVSQPTVREYLEIANGTFIWRRINAFARSSVRRIVKMPKGLYRDCGLSNYLLYLFNLNQLRSSPLVGSLWEAMIIEEILKGCALASLRVEPSFYRTSDGREVDLVLEGEFGLIPIEIKYGRSVDTDNLKPLRTFISEYGLNLGIVISNTDKVRLIDPQIVEIPACMV